MGSFVYRAFKALREEKAQAITAPLKPVTEAEEDLVTR